MLGRKSGGEDRNDQEGVGHHWMEGTELDLTVPTFGIHIGYSVRAKIPSVRRVWIEKEGCTQELVIM